MNKDSKEIFAYARTILFSILAGCLVTGGIIYYAQYDVINNASLQYNEKTLNEYIKNTVISQNEDLESEYPNNYRIDIHLGYLHKVIKEYDKAEAYYKKAVQKAPLNVYKPLYELASFYIERKRYDEAIDIIEGLPEKSNSNLLIFQAYLYKKMGDAHYEDGKYYNSMTDYENSLYYWTKQQKPKTKFIKQVNQKIATSAVNLGDICVNEDKPREAVLFLERALKAKPKDYNICYKLALANANINPEQSYKYFDYLFKKDPTRIDYVIYYQVLENLSAYYDDIGDGTKSKLFAFRAKNLLDTVSEQLIYPKDVEFKVIGATLYKLNNKSKILLKFNMQNISALPIKRLNMDVVYKLNGKEIETYKKVLIDSTNKLEVGESIPESTIIPTLFRKYKQEEIPEISAEIYLYKSVDRKICVFNDKLFKTAKVNVKHSNVEKIDCSTYIRFFASQILNFENSVQTYRDSRK